MALREASGGQLQLSSAAATAAVPCTVAGKARQAASEEALVATQPVTPRAGHGAQRVALPAVALPPAQWASDQRVGDRSVFHSQKYRMSGEAAALLRHVMPAEPGAILGLVQQAG